MPEQEKTPVEVILAGKLNRLDEIRKQLIRDFSSRYIFLPYSTSLTGIFNLLNYCASNKLWHYDNQSALMNSLPAQAYSGSFYINGTLKQQGTGLATFTQYNKGDTLIKKLDTIFNWKKAIIEKLKDNTQASNLSESSSLNTIFYNSLSWVNHFGNGYNDSNSKYPSVSLPKYIPNLSNSKYYTGIKLPYTVDNMTMRTQLTEPIIEDGKTKYVTKYTWEYGGYNNREEFTFVTPSEYMLNQANQYAVSNHRTPKEEYDRIKNDTWRNYHIYPIPEYEDAKITFKEGMRINIGYMNPCYLSYLDQNERSGSNGIITNPWNPNADVKKNYGYYVPFYVSEPLKPYTNSEMEIIDHLPYNFNIYLVENKTTRTLDGLVGDIVRFNDYKNNFNYLYKQDKNMMSLFIDFSVDDKFLNPYELSHVLIPKTKATDGKDYICRDIVNIFFDTQMLRDQYNNNYNKKPFYGNHDPYRLDLVLPNYNSQYDPNYYKYNQYNNYYSEDNVRNQYGTFYFGNFLSQQTIYTYNYSSNQQEARKVYYVQDSWRLEAIFKKRNIPSINEFEKYPFIKSWTYYDITGFYSSYLLGVFPVNDDDTIDYDNPILYRHVLPSTAYAELKNSRERVVLKDIFNRENDYNPSYEMYKNTNTNSGVTYNKVNYTASDKIRAGSLFYRNENCPHLNPIVLGDGSTKLEKFSSETYLRRLVVNNKIEIPKTPGKIAIKLYHSIPEINVPAFLRREQYNEEDRPFTSIADTLYTGQTLAIEPSDSNNSGNIPPKFKEIKKKSSKYLYDVTESILNTKAVIIDPSKATYNNVPIMNPNIELKIFRITKDAIYVSTVNEKDDYILDILYNVAKWWFTLPDFINDKAKKFKRSITPDSIEEVVTGIKYTFTNSSNNDSGKYSGQVGDPKRYFDFHNDYLIDKTNESKYFYKRKMLKLNVCFDNFGDDHTFFTQDVNNIEYTSLNGQGYLIYLNFSVSNNIFYNDTFLNYDIINSTKSSEKIFLKEIDGQYIFRTITPKDHIVQKNATLSSGISKDYGLDANIPEKAYDGSSNIVYSIGITPNIFNDLKFKPRKYKINMKDTTVTEAEKATLKTDFEIDEVNGFLQGSTPIKSEKSVIMAKLPKGKTYTEIELTGLREQLGMKLSYPVNLNEMSIEEIESLLSIPENTVNNGSYTQYQTSENLLNAMLDRDDSNSDNNIKIKNAKFVANRNNGGKDYYVTEENSIMYYKKSSLLFILFYYIVIAPKLKNFYIDRTVDSNNKINIKLCVDFEDRDHQIARLKEFFKEQEEARKDQEQKTYNASHYYVGSSPSYRNEYFASYFKTEYGSIFGESEMSEYLISLIEYINGSGVLGSSGGSMNDAAKQAFFEDATGAANSEIYKNENNLYYAYIYNLFIKFDMNWLIMYTPGIDKEKDRKIADMLYKLIPTLNTDMASMRNKRNSQPYNPYYGSSSNTYSNIINNKHNSNYNYIEYLIDKLKEGGYSSYNNTVLKTFLNTFYSTDGSRNNMTIKNYVLEFFDYNYGLNYINSSELMNRWIKNRPYTGITIYESDNNLYPIREINYDIRMNNNDFKKVLQAVNDINPTHMIDKYQPISFSKFTSSTKYVDNPFMGRAIEYTSDIEHIPSDTRAVLLRISFKNINGSNLTEILMNNNFDEDILKKYNKKNIAIIMIITLDDLSNTNHMPDEFKNIVSNVTDEFGSGIGFTLTDRQLTFSHEDESKVVFSNRLSSIAVISSPLSKPLIVDGMYYRIKNKLIPMAGFLETTGTGNNVTHFIGDKINETEARLMKKGVLIGGTMIEFPDTLEKFKSVLDDTYDELLWEIQKGIKYYKLGNYDVPNEYLEKWNKVKSKIGYRYAVNSIHKVINQFSYEKSFDKASTDMRLDVVTLSKAGLTEQKYWDISNIYSNLKMNIVFSVYRKYDNAHIVDVTYPINDIQNTVTLDEGINKGDIVLDVNGNVIIPNIDARNITGGFSNISDYEFFSLASDFRKLSLLTHDMSLYATIKNTPSTVTKEMRTREHTTNWYDGTQNTYTETYYEIVHKTIERKQNLLNLTGYSNYYVVFKYRLTPMTDVPGIEWDMCDLNFANAGFETYHGVLLNQLTLDSFFISLNTDTHVE